MIALVTGGDQGLGAAVVRALEEESYEVRVIPGAALRHATQEDVVHALHRALPLNDDWSQLAVIVNNYGINHLSWIGSTTEADADILRVNVMVPYWVLNSVVAHLAASGIAPLQTRYLINVASQTYRIAQRTTSLYCASKAALIQMTRVMARELAGSGWVINAVAPGKMVDTEMAARTDAQVLDLRQWTKEGADRYAQEAIPMKRHTSTTEVAAAIVGLLKMPAYVNGTVLDITGGL